MAEQVMQDTVVQALLDSGMTPAKIADQLGVTAGGVRNFIRRHGLRRAAAVVPADDDTMPEVWRYIDGDDRAISDLLKTMTPRQAAEVLRILESAKRERRQSIRLEQDARSADVVWVSDILQFAVRQSSVHFGGESDPTAAAKLRLLWTDVDAYIRGNHPVLVDRMSRAGVPL